MRQDEIANQIISGTMGSSVKGEVPFARELGVSKKIIEGNQCTVEESIYDSFKEKFSIDKAAHRSDTKQDEEYLSSVHELKEMVDRRGIGIMWKNAPELAEKLPVEKEYPESKRGADRKKAAFKIFTKELRTAEESF